MKERYEEINEALKADADLHNVINYMFWETALCFLE